MSESLEFGLKGALQKMRGSDEEGKIQFVILYGSAAEGKEGELSDIDLAAGYDGSKGERFDFRVRVLGDLPDKFDVQIFQDLPLYLKMEALKGQVLYYRDFRELHEIAMETIKGYQFFKPNFLDYIRR